MASARCAGTGAEGSGKGVGSATLAHQATGNGMSCASAVRQRTTLYQIFSHQHMNCGWGWGVSHMLCMPRGVFFRADGRSGAVP